MAADQKTYLAPITEEFSRQWPDTPIVNLVCHGHSVPAGYTSNSMVKPFDAYPHQLHRMLKDRFPYAMINVIVTAIGGENAILGCGRFERDVLSHRPELLTIDYAMNDRFLDPAAVESAWRRMVETALRKNIKVILVTPTMDCGAEYYNRADIKADLPQLRQMIRDLADEYKVGLADAYAAFERALAQGRGIMELLAGLNHPSAEGHRLVACELLRWFPFYPKE